jgi:hypothetical protein
MHFYKWRALRVTLEDWNNNNKNGLDFREPASMTCNIQINNLQMGNKCAVEKKKNSSKMLTTKFE